MSTIRSFEDIEAWQAARQLSNDIFELTTLGTFSKDYSLRDQVNRSSGSVMDNIAEGFERGGTREFLQFLSYSRASCAEVRSQLYRAFDRKHVTEDVFLSLKDRAIKVSKMITGLMYYLRRTNYKGFKFHKPDGP